MKYKQGDSISHLSLAKPSKVGLAHSRVRDNNHIHKMRWHEIAYDRGKAAAKRHYGKEEDHLAGGRARQTQQRRQ